MVFLFLHFQVWGVQANPSCILPAEQQLPQAFLHLCRYWWMPRNNTAYSLYTYISFLSRWREGWWNVWCWRRATARSFVVALLRCRDYPVVDCTLQLSNCVKHNNILCNSNYDDLGYQHSCFLIVIHVLMWYQPLL